MKKTCKLLIFTLFILFIFNTIVYADDEIEVEAKAALIVEKNTEKIIYEKNIYEQNYPASVTKILTAILAIENCDLEEYATVSQSAISNVPFDYLVAPLFVGEQMKIKDLLYALMLKSSNDAAYVLAEHIGGSVEGFSDMMNKKAKELGCKNTHFVNPNGIHDDDHYTSAYDMYLISKYAMQNKTFANLVSTYKYTLPATNMYSYEDRVMENTNKFLNPDHLLYNENVKGIKTGNTDEAGHCLITYIEKDNLGFYIVVLGAETKESRFAETSRLIDYAYDNYTYTDVYKKGDIVKNIKVNKATDKTKNLNLIIDEDMTVFNNKKVNPKEMEPEINLDSNISAPISKGQVVGTIKYNIDGNEYSAKLLAENDVELRHYYIEISVAVIILLLILIIIRKRKSKMKSRRRR